MEVKIFKNGVQINTIVSDETFAKAYCEKHGYTYEAIPEPEPEPEPPAPPEYTELQSLAQALTDEELARIELGQQLTDLELSMLEGGESNV